MVKYTIPEPVQIGFKKIISFNPEELKVLSTIIETAKVGEDVTKLSEVHCNKIPSINKDEFTMVLHALFSLVHIFADSKNNIEKFTIDFSDSYKETVENASVEDGQKLKSNLSQLLPSFTSVKMTVKAEDLLRENCNNFLDARIISDIRIVFDDDDMKKNEQCALVVHNLKIKHFTQGKRNSFFVSLNLSDLNKLKKVIERAIEKDTFIRANNHNLEFIDLN